MPLKLEWIGASMFATGYITTLLTAGTPSRLEVMFLAGLMMVGPILFLLPEVQKLKGQIV